MLKYNEDEVLQHTLDYFDGDDLASSAWMNKYALKKGSDKGLLYAELTPHDMHDRIAREIALKDVQFKYGTDITTIERLGADVSLKDEQLDYYYICFNKYREAFNNFSKIVPQGSPMSGIGNPFAKVSLSNCVVVPSPADNMSSIMETGKELANLFKRRCGVGVDISTLRPDGTTVSNSAGSSTGAWSFSEHFSNVCRMVGQNGRRGALMLTIDVRHPDVDKFIVMKRDKTRVTGANISIKLTDEFMQAVSTDAYWICRWPVEDHIVKNKPKHCLTACNVEELLLQGGEWLAIGASDEDKNNGIAIDYDKWISNNHDEKRVLKRFKAKELWWLINEAARTDAEPGLLFWDNYINNLPAHCYSKFFTISTNPCVTKDTWVLTSNGAIRVGDLIGKQFTATVDGKPYKSTEKGFFNTGKKQVFQINTNRGFSIKVTENHEILTEQRKTIKCKSQRIWKKAKDLVIGDNIVIMNHINNNWQGYGTRQEGWLLGNLLGDGNITKDNMANLDYWGETQLSMQNYAINTIKSTVGCRKDLVGYMTSNNIVARVSSANLFKLANKFGLTNDSKILTDKIESASSEFICGFLNGWFDADGSVQGSQQKGVSIRLTSAVFNNLISAQRMLARLGIISTIYENRHQSGNKIMPDGNGGHKEYLCNAIHELVIANNNIVYFAERIGFIDNEKKIKLENILQSYKRKINCEKFVSCVSEIIPVGIEEVYDCTVPNINAFDANGLYVHNCAEIALSPYDSCRLTSINLKGFVKKAFTKSAYFDFKDFESHVRTGMRIMDNIVDLEIDYLKDIIDKVDEDEEKVIWEKLRNAAIDGRRTGLGTHGLADALICLNLKYDGDEALEIIDKIYAMLRDTAYDASIDLAIERGAFPEFNWEIEKNCLFIKRLPQKLQDKMATYGRRNISLLTNAPTGTVSIESRTSSGIEPVFGWYYTRRKKINPSDPNAHVDYVDQSGDKWANYMVFHPTLQEYLIQERPELWQTWQNIQDNFALASWNEELGKILEGQLPNFFINAPEINSIRRVEIQGMIQQYIDHGISSTLNLPKGTTVETVQDIYLKSWKAGLKGVTVYVDGCRSGVLINAAAKEIKGIPESTAPKRPDILECDIHFSNIDGKKWTILVGKLEDQPYEIFGGLSETIEISQKNKIGRIKKRKCDRATIKGRLSCYDLILGEAESPKVIIEDIVSSFDDGDHAHETRLISMLLRHGAPIHLIADTFGREHNSNLYSFSKVMARVLKKYVVDGTTSSENCKECNSKLRFEGGCRICPQCGGSKCD